MRLLNVHDRTLQEFISGDNVPPYAILSHTWGNDEIRMQEWEPIPSPQLRSRMGFRKLDYCCQQAMEDDIDWIWADTCCIDKASSAELSEAINSMFRWYQSAEVCYAYLPDVSKDPKLRSFEAEFRQSKWYTRGWTLQELIAPKRVVFYSKDWVKLGCKSSLSALISDITRIEEKFLFDADLSTASISARMSWASRRVTTRSEDVAYCLLGLFDVNMPLIYGEGARAFERLQEEIMRRYPLDHTLFAWGNVIPRHNYAISVKDVLRKRGPIVSNSKPVGNLYGLLAEAPSDFQDSGAFIPHQSTLDFYLRNAGVETKLVEAASFPSIVGNDVILHLPIVAHPYAIREWSNPKIKTVCLMFVALLLCHHRDSPGFSVELPLVSHGARRRGRTRDIICNKSRSSIRSPYSAKGIKESMFICASLSPLTIQPGNIMLRRWYIPRGYHALAYNTPQGIIFYEDDGLVKAGPDATGLLLTMGQRYDSRRGFSFVFSRRPSPPGDEEGPKYSLYIGIRPLLLGSGAETHVVEDGIKWVRTRALKDECPYNHKVDGLSDRWTLDVPPLPRFEFAVDRIPLDGDLNRLIDVVDIIGTSQAELRQAQANEPAGPVTRSKKRRRDAFETSN